MTVSILNVKIHYGTDCGRLCILNGCYVLLQHRALLIDLLLSRYGFKICLQGLAKVRNTNMLYLIIYNSLIQCTRNYIVGIGMHNELQKLNGGFYCRNG